MDARFFFLFLRLKDYDVVTLALMETLFLADAIMTRLLGPKEVLCSGT
jgi:hypothetical protein